MSRHSRRYSPWLLHHEESLRLRQDSLTRVVIILAAIIALTEAMLDWSSFTPSIPPLIHIVVTGAALPLLWFLWGADLKRKQQSFTLAMSDKGRRLLFLDAYMEPEEFAFTEQLQGAHLLPLQRQMQAAMKTGTGRSLHQRLDLFYRTLPSTSHEGDRLGLLSALHPATFVKWVLALAVAFFCAPGIGLELFGNDGLTLLPLLLLLYLFAARANTRFAYEHALFEWLRQG